MLPRRFLKLARLMLAYPAMLAFAVVMALVSAAGLGIGIASLVPILGPLLGSDGEQETLRSMAQDAAVDRGWPIPQGFIARLPDEPYHSLVVVFIAVGVLTVIGAVANFAHSMASATLVIRVVSDVRRRAYRRLLRLPLISVTARSGMDLVSRALHDAQQLSSGLGAVVNKALASITKAVAAFATALLIDARLTLAAAVALPLLAILVRKLAKVIRRAAKRAMHSQAELLAAAGQAIPALRTVKLNQAERIEAGRFAAANRRMVDAQLRSRLARSLSAPVTELVGLFVIGALALIAGKAIIDEAVSPAAFIATLAALAVGAGELKKLTAVVNDVQQAEAASQRLLELIEMPVEPEGPRHEKLPRHARSIVFDRVSVVYPGAGSAAVKDVDLEIEHGRRVAFVGPNGSGKTTLLSLVPRLFDPVDGRVLIDGVDLKSVNLRSIRRQIAVVSQETHLFAGTVASNIAYATRATDEQIRDAAARARASQFIEALPDGYDTVLGDSGMTLSGGQRQRLAIARAILREPSVLILDEATSMIDSESEAAINEALAEFAKGRTTLVIAHRLSTVQHADLIVVMDAGSIAGVGTHTELLESSELYQRLVAAQLQPA